MDSQDHTQPTRGFDRFFRYLEYRHPSDHILLYVGLLTFICACIYMLFAVNASYLRPVPSDGGVLREGILGTPRFVNPVLAITRADQDLVALTYSGLMRPDQSGNLTPHLAESVTISDDGLVYNVVMRNDVVFHDNTPLTAEDVAFTIGLIQDPELKSPLRGNWSGVSVEVLGTHEVNFVLESPYTPFIENLTVGILPKHIFESLSIEELPFSQHNTEPIGSGPYFVKDIHRTTAGLIDAYTLERFENARPHAANIHTIGLTFYQHEADIIAALQDDAIDTTASLSYESLHTLGDQSYDITTSPLPRVFSVFFNQNRSAALRDSAAREALDAMVDRDALVDEVLHGYGSKTHTPIPPTFLSTSGATSTAASGTPLARASLLLEDGGWVRSEHGWEKDIDGASTTLSITIATANAPIFERTATYLERTWNELGVSVRIELFEQSDLVQQIIRPREYEALLFGSDVGRALDLYPFWHSSQQEDPGLNVALYANITTDALLEDARNTRDTEVYTEHITNFIAEIAEEAPAVFLFSPSFAYVTQGTLARPESTRIARPSERFAHITDWYMQERDVWPIFTD